MTKKEVPETLNNFWIYNPTGISIQLVKLFDEDLGYTSQAMFHLNEEDSDAEQNITFPIGVTDVDASTVITRTLGPLSALFNVPIYTQVLVFDEDGEFIEELDLNDLLPNEEFPHRTESVTLQ